MDLVAAELLCRACGDAACRFVMAPPGRIEAHVARFARSSAGRPARGVAAIPDFFARKRMEEELRRAHAELERRVEERTQALTRAKERLEREIEERERAESRLLQTYKLEAIGRLAGGIAHDFNNLMAIITVNADLLQQRLPEGDAARGFLDDIAAAGARAAALTQQLLAFSRAQPARTAVLDLNAIVTDLGRMLSRLIGDDVLLVTRLAPGLGAVVADRGQLEQVLMNLVVNARDAMPGGGTLTLSTADVEIDAARAAELGGVTAGPYVVLGVRDTGIGMDEETLAHIYDPFFTTKGPLSMVPRSGRSSGGGAVQGTGLGLATVYGIVQQAGGAIAVTSAMGQGTEFFIYLPRTDAAPSGRRSEGEGAGATHGSETILVVEDQERLREAIAVVLQGFGYEVLAARDAIEAERFADVRQGPIDLLLTDVVMPRTSGPVLAERLRILRPGIRVLFMSGYAADVMRDHPGLQGGAALLAKPFRPDELGRAVRQALSSDSSRA
jgi:signal transduction histidine kinase/ActR/RegA family two-component response regulator